MSNETIFILSALVDISAVFIAAQVGKKWLFSTIAINLMLVAIFGAKIIEVFGMTTNAANAFYACVFFATYMIFEQYGKKIALKTIWYGVAFVLVFSLLSQLTTLFVGSPASGSVNDALTTLFSFSFRVTFASILAFVFAQYINIVVYGLLSQWTKGTLLWFRSNGAHVVSQLVDSLIFFTIVFFNQPGPLIVQAILAGWFIKVCVVLLGTPLLYINQFLKKKYT